MTVRTTCDLCGKPITEGEERVDVRVDPRWSPFLHRKRASNLEELTEESKSLLAMVNRKESLRLSLDLHLACYVERILPCLPDEVKGSGHAEAD